MSVTIPSDITVMMDIDLRRHHEQSGAWSKKGVRPTEAGKRKRKTERNTTAESGGGKNKMPSLPEKGGGELALAKKRSVLGVIERKNDKRRGADWRADHGAHEDDGGEESTQEESVDCSINDGEGEARSPIADDKTYEEARSEVWHGNDEAVEGVDSDENSANDATEIDATTGRCGMGMGGRAAKAGASDGADEDVSRHKTSGRGELAAVRSTSVGVGCKDKKRIISGRHGDDENSSQGNEELDDYSIRGMRRSRR